MTFSNFNPPFTNRNLEDFFEYQSLHTEKANRLKNWVLDTFPDLEIGLAYHVPFIFYNKKKLFYFHYVKNAKDKSMSLEMSFVKGVSIKDLHNLFQSKNKETKAIPINTLNKDFFDKLKYYIEESINLQSK